MKYTIRLIETIQEMEGLIWEVPRANYKLPVLAADATKEEVLAHLELEESAIANCLVAFEQHNHVLLQGEPEKHFRTVAGVIYSA